MKIVDALKYMVDNEGKILKCEKGESRRFFEGKFQIKKKSGEWEGLYYIIDGIERMDLFIDNKFVNLMEAMDDGEALFQGEWVVFENGVWIFRATARTVQATTEEKVFLNINNWRKK